MFYTQMFSNILGSAMSSGFYNLYWDCKTYLAHIQIVWDVKSTYILVPICLWAVISMYTPD